jgi:TnpA family transposase
MKNLYPSFQESYTQDELIEHFWLTNDEIVFVQTFRSEVNQQAVAILLKCLKYFGFFPADFDEVPESVKLFIAHELNSLWDMTEQYDWLSSAKDRHYSLIREFSGWHSATNEDKENLIRWLEEKAAGEIGSEEELFEAAIKRLKYLCIELPSRKELERLTSTVWNTIFQGIYLQIENTLTTGQKEVLDKLLIVEDSESFSTFDKLKASVGKAGVENFSKEANKLKQIREVVFSAELPTKVPPKLLRILSRRAKNEKAGEMKSHPAHIRYALLVCFLFTRKAEITDNLGQMFLTILQKLERGSEKEVDKEVVRDFKRVDGKPQILYRVACAVTENPSGSVSDVIFTTVKEEVFQNIIVEHETGGSYYRTRQRYFLKNKYVRHYQRILPVLLDNLTFRSGNRRQPIIEALEIIKKYVGTNYQYFPEDVPTDIVTPTWKTTVFEKVGDELKVNRKGYELCVLHKLEKALKCKEVWIEGAHTFRNPQKDLPDDWEAKRHHYYEMLSQKTKAEEFIADLKEQMHEALHDFNLNIPRNPHIKIYAPNDTSDKGLFSLQRLEAQDEPNNIEHLKHIIGREYGILDLLDVFVEADNLADFTSSFRHSGTKQIRSQEQLRPLILLNLFAEGTNTGVKRIARANHHYKYDELLYVRKHYFSAEALRLANIKVVNKLLELRNPHIWGTGNACASDGKRFGSWKNNLLSEWKNRYKGDGVLIYWHVQTNAVCLYSQLKSFSSSEVAAMIEGLIRHDTEMRVEKNFVDSHGQSEVAFAFCKLLGFQLMPRLKRIKYEKLYLPDKGLSGEFENLDTVLTRTIRWKLIESQYDEMIKHAAALKLGTASAESILRRFNSYNKTHPTYKALAELGKAEKTIFLCKYLSSIDLRYEINEGLNVVERWNGVNDFIRYGRQGVFATNSHEHQEISTFALQLLQNCLMLINTILVEKTIEKEKMFNRLSVEDLRAISPLFYEHINPYGVFEIDVTRPSFLEKEVA